MSEFKAHIAKAASGKPLTFDEARAHEDLSGRRTTGKSLLIP